MRALCVLCLLSTSALAWESQCAVEPVSRARTVRPAYDHVCAKDGLATCEEGYEAARGAFFGEHTLITELAMRKAGLVGSVVDEEHVLSYFTDQAPAPHADGPAQTLEPACPGAMHVDPARRFAVWEFAQVPDYSYSISDWVMGNEHCPVSRLLDYSAGANQSCHTFASHSSVVNSAHFPPQSRAIYRRYHALALETMQRCKKMYDARAAQGTKDAANFTRWKQLISACEYEALAFQSTASHYLEDAWSAGHMWQRWGSPIFPEPGDYLRNHLVGAYSGTLHGVRGPIREVAGPLGDLSLAQDQMCRPGPQDVYQRIVLPGPLPVSVKTTKRVADPPRFSYPTGDLTLHWMGGDTYLEQCTADGIAVDDALEGGSELSFQFKRMVTCVAQGFHEVYKVGPLVLNVYETRLDPALDPAITASDGDLCWAQRAINDSMFEGTRFGDTEGGLFKPSWVGDAVQTFLETRPVFSPDGDKTAAGRAIALSKRKGDTDLVRAEAIRIGTYMKLRAGSHPANTDLANLESNAVRIFAGVQRNEDYLSLYATDIVDGDGIPQFERAGREKWLTAPSTLACTRDSDCLVADPHAYCDRWAGLDDAGVSLARCTHLEAPVVRAFRDAEAAAWCGGDSFKSLEEARAACKGKAAAAPECRACVQVIAPKLRNACDPGMQGGLQNPSVPSPKSVCDALQAAVVTTARAEPAVNWPYARQGSETWDEASQRAALEACQWGAQGTASPTPALDYMYRPDVPANPELVSQGNQTFTQNGGLCGRSETPVQLIRWKSSGDYSRAWQLELTTRATSFFGTPQPVSRLKLELLAGPRCDPALDLRATGTLISTDGGVPDTLSIPWTVVDGTADDICVRVSAGDERVRTGYSLVRRF